jgi:hypothetical protein
MPLLASISVYKLYAGPHAKGKAFFQSHFETDFFEANKSTFYVLRILKR